MSARLVKLGDDVSYCVADARNLFEPVFGDERIERDGEGRQAIGSPRIGFRPVGIATAQGGALRIFSQETCNGARVERRQSTNLPCRALQVGIKATLKGRGVIGPLIDRLLKLLRCPKVLKVLGVRTIRGLFLEETIDPPGHKLKVLHPALWHRSGLARARTAKARK